MTGVKETGRGKNGKGGLKNWRYRLEGWGAQAMFALFRTLGLERASALGGWLGRSIGPRLGVQHRAERRLRRALPELDDAAVAAALRDMWDNLGRTLAEYPHLASLAGGDGHTELVGGAEIGRLRDDGIGGILFSGHIGNWEVLAPLADRLGLPLSLVYRAANNPYVETLIQQARGHASTGRHLAKGPAGAKALIAGLRRGEHFGILVDQKLNDGIAVPFFGRPAMTAPAVARLALRFHLPLVPVRVERLRGTRLRVTVFPPLPPPDSGDDQADVLSLMTEVNRVLESWVRERPAQWFWLHNRWPD